MSHLVPPQEEKATTASQYNLPVDHEVPPQYQASTADSSFLIPPQQEKAKTATGQAQLDKNVNRLEKEINSHVVQKDTLSRDDEVRYKQMAASALAGAAGVTGEDVGTAENQRLV